MGPKPSRSVEALEPGRALIWESFEIQEFDESGNVMDPGILLSGIQEFEFWLERD